MVNFIPTDQQVGFFARLPDPVPWLHSGVSLGEVWREAAANQHSVEQLELLQNQQTTVDISAGSSLHI